MQLRTLNVLMPFLLFTNLMYCQSIDLTKEAILVKYNTIRTQLASYDIRITTILDESTDGGEASAFYDKNNELKLIEVNWFGETGKRVTDYCFDKGKLIFVLDQEFSYNRPIYWDEGISQDMGDSEVFDPDKTTLHEDRYFFDNEKLILWINNDGKSEDLTLGTNTLVGQGLIAYAYKKRIELKK